MVCKLNTRCSILAATNPKGNYDFAQTLEVNLALGSPLLSRFDLIFILIDSRNQEWDKTISSHIFAAETGTKKSHPSKDNFWPKEKLKSYITYCKTFQPELTKDSETVLSLYYQHQRRIEGRNTMRTTIRLLESLIRLAQAHARFMCKNEVTRQDAVMAVYLMEASAFGTGLFGGRINIQRAFVNDPDVEYQNLETIVMTKLGIPVI